jgi:hypothetical protein
MEYEQEAKPRGSTRGWGRLAAVGLILAGSACYPGDGPANVQDLDVVMTIHDQKVDFGSFTSFAMPDTVLHVSSDEGDDIIDLPRDYDELVLDLVADNMEVAGYVREMEPEDNGADLILLVAAIGTEKTKYWASGGWWGYWGWYPGWGYPGYPGYGPGWGWGYPPYVGSVNFEQGTIVLTLVDPNRGEGEELPVIWSGSARGLLNYGGATGRITSAINQMFSQSPYLGR